MLIFSTQIVKEITANGKSTANGKIYTTLMTQKVTSVMKPNKVMKRIYTAQH